MSKTKAVADWEDLLRERGCIITGRCDIHLHHIYGRTFKHNKILIGPWAILPLWWEMHDSGMTHPRHVHKRRKAFNKAYGWQGDVFLAMCQDILYIFPEGKRITIF